MKKTLLSLCLLIGLSLSASAQIKFGLGLKAGLNFADIDISDGPDGRTGWHAGAFARLKFTKFAIQAEILYSAQGNDELDLDYINIPILAKFYVVGGLNVYLGPQFGFNVNSSQLELVDENENTVGFADAFDESDISGVIGAGFDLPFGLTIDARYNLGFSDLNNLEDFGFTESVKSRVFQVSVGYFLFGK